VRGAGRGEGKKTFGWYTTGSFTMKTLPRARNSPSINLIIIIIIIIHRI
jgi:hypothetical protein